MDARRETATSAAQPTVSASMARGEEHVVTVQRALCLRSAPTIRRRDVVRTVADHLSACTAGRSTLVSNAAVHQYALTVDVRVDVKIVKVRQSVSMEKNDISVSTATVKAFVSIRDIKPPAKYVVGRRYANMVNLSQFASNAEDHLYARNTMFLNSHAHSAETRVRLKNQPIL